MELGALAEGVDTVVADRARRAVGYRAPVDDRTRTDDERAVVPGCVEEYARVAAEDRAALALARHEGDPESGCLPEQRPEQGAAEVVEVHPVALAGESRELPARCSAENCRNQACCSGAMPSRFIE